MHAWTEVYLPGAGWIGIDSTNNAFTTHAFIPTAVSAEPDYISPVQGGYISKRKIESIMSVDLNLRDVSYDPSPVLA